MGKPTNVPDENVVVEVSHRDVLVETVQTLEQRGFEPVLIVFRNSDHEIEVLTRGGIKLDEFVAWLLSTWIPASRDLRQGGGQGH